MKTALASLCALVFVGAAQANISITGNGKVTYIPNIAHVHVSVSSEAATAAEAWQKNGEIVKKLFGVLKDFGVDEKDFKTTGLNISPRYHYPKEKPAVLIGYTVTYDLHITARQLDKVGAMLDQLVANGANRGMGIAFSHDKLQELVEEARLRAVSDARRRADLYVKAAGGSLGTLVSIHEGGNFTPKMVRFEHAPMSSDAGLPIAGGQQELGASVTVTYSINNGLRS